MVTLPCIKCEKPLDSAIPDTKDTNQPSGGTAFYSHGHYGSMWDPMPFAGSQFLEVNVCDECLTQAGRDGRVFLGQSERKTATTLGPWNPDDID